MHRELLGASARALHRGAVVGPVLAATVLAVLAVPVLDDGWALHVLRGVGVVLGLAVVVAVDDPAGVVLAASPHSAAKRTLARAVVVLAVALPVWSTAAVLARWKAEVPVGAVALETAGWWVLGLAVAAAVWRVSGTLSPSYVAGPALLGLALAADGLPRAWALLAQQTWGPPWEAAHLRWVAVLLAGTAVAAWALRDPLDRAAGRRRSD
jgi:hypothetical protein